MKNNISDERRFRPAQFLALSFVGAISVGTLLLMLPFSTESGHISFLDALFTATSAVCVTGLMVLDTATYFSPAGQAIILGLFQIGGLGIMTFSTLILLVAGKKISIKDRLLVQQEFHHAAPKNVTSLVKNIFLYAFSLELAGALVLFFNFREKFPTMRAVFLSVFHSISAFCNAGFSLFSTSFEAYRDDTIINITLILLIVLGGMGFLVLHELKAAFSKLISRKRLQLSIHSKLVLSMIFFLVVFSFFMFLFIEWNGALQGLGLKDKIFSSLFQVITPRTAGFNTMDLNSLSSPAVFLLITLMFVGASPGSTGGGVKTSTIGVIFSFLRSKLTARDSVNLFYRTLPVELITKAYTVVTLGICLISISAFILFLSQPDASMEEIFFEVFSAFGTVGLSLGLTPKLYPVGKIVIILTMYIGRIGPLALLYAFSKHKSHGRYEYVEETVMIG